MNIDTERKAQLERDKAGIEARLAAVSDAGDDVLRPLRERIRQIEEELRRMEFAAEVERQSDA